MSRFDESNIKLPWKLILTIVISLTLFILAWMSTVIIEPGTVGVQVLWGKANDQLLIEGMNIVNPFSGVIRFQTRQDTFKEEKVTVPSQDKLVTELDVSVQYRVIGNVATQIYRETGNQQDLIRVHLEPKLRSLLREVGKEVLKSEDFFKESTQQMLQTKIAEELSNFCRPKGLEIQAVLLRDIRLPAVVVEAVNATTKRVQAGLMQQAELTRFTTEQQQKVRTAEAEKDAAVKTAEKMKIEADAESYKIRTLNDAIASNPAYVQLQALKTLAEMAKDPAAKFYFIDGQSKSPLPLLHLSDDFKKPVGQKTEESHR